MASKLRCAEQRACKGEVAPLKMDNLASTNPLSARPRPLSNCVSLHSAYAPPRRATPRHAAPRRRHTTQGTNTPIGHILFRLDSLFILRNHRRLLALKEWDKQKTPQTRFRSWKCFQRAFSFSSTLLFFIPLFLGSRI